MMKKVLLSLLLLAQPAHAATRNVPADTVQFTRKASAPSSPLAGTVFGYALDSDGKFYIKNSSGTAKACTYSGDIVDADISSSAAIANSKFANMSQSTIKGRAAGAGSGAPSDLSATQAQAIVGSVPQILAHQSTPSNPASGSVALYFKSDNKLYRLTSAGSEAEVGGSSGGTWTLSTFTSGGTLAVPSTAKRLRIWGCGGGGGGAATSGGGSPGNASAGGGGSFYPPIELDATPYAGTTLTIAIGTGGAGTPNGTSPGSDGGNSTVSSAAPAVIWKAFGGKGGAQSSGGRGMGLGGDGGTGGSGVADGNPGGDNKFDGLSVGGAGGSNNGGGAGGGGGGAGCSTGNAGAGGNASAPSPTGYGGGGGGGGKSAGGGNASGGDGSPGKVFIEYQ